MAATAVGGHREMSQSANTELCYQSAPSIAFHYQTLPAGQGCTFCMYTCLYHSLHVSGDCGGLLENTVESMKCLLEATTWPESASELYRPSDRRLSVKLVPTFADRGCHGVSLTDPYGRILDF
jgi:hypothetical protein